jgi:hypothetical protein
MRKFLLLILTVIPLQAFSQILVQGKIRDNNGENLPGAVISEIGAGNSTTSDIEGSFSLKTIQDSCKISFSFIGLDTQTITLTKDSTLNISLDFGDFYNTRWLSIGTNYESFNSVIGLQLSNGVDEEPLIHFEDFQDDLLIKIHGQTDLNDNYSYGAEIGVYSLKYVGRTTLKYDVMNFENSELFLTDFNLTSRIRYFRNTGLIFRTGYQKFNNNENYGIGLGIEQGGQNFYFGMNSRYYFDYFHHEAYLQIQIPTKNILSFRTVYNRIDNKNLLTIGLNYAFVRNKK